MIILYGAGTLGIYTLRGLRSLGVEPACFVSDNPDQWYTQVEGLPVFPIGDALAKHPDGEYVVTIFNGARALSRLQAEGVKCEKYLDLFYREPQTFLPYLCLSAEQRGFADPRVGAAYDLWNDQDSRIEYVMQIAWRIERISGCLPAQTPTSDIYFPPFIDLTRYRDFVDAGAYDGDTIRKYIARVGNAWDSITAIEPDPARRLELTGLATAVHSVAVGAEHGETRFQFDGTISAHQTNEGHRIPVLPLDYMLTPDKAYLIKMDVEGAEMGALLGAANLLKAGRSAWAICLYHRPDDIWQIPLYIRSVQPNYNLYLRRYGEDCWEAVLYAVPKELEG